MQDPENAPVPAPRSPLSKERLGALALLSITETLSHVGPDDALPMGQHIVTQLTSLGVPHDEALTFTEEVLRDALRLAFTPRPKKDGTPEPKMHQPVPNVTGHPIFDGVLHHFGIGDIRSLFREYSEQMRKKL